MGFSGQEYGSRSSFPTPGNLSRDWTSISCIAGEFFTTEPSGKPAISFQFSSVAQSCPTLCKPIYCSTPGLPAQVLTFTQTHVHRVSNAIQPSHPLSSPSPPSILASIRVFSNESALHITWPKCWSFSFNISPSNEHPGLISFRMEWLDLLAVHGTLKSLLQHHSSKPSILQCLALFIVQLSHPYMTTGKTIALTRWTFVGKAISFISIVVFLSNTMKATLIISCFTWSGLIAFTSTSVLTFLPL